MTPVPTAAPVATETVPVSTETAPTDIPTGQPTKAEEPKSSGFGALAALAGLGVVAVLRRT